MRQYCWLITNMTISTTDHLFHLIGCFFKLICCDLIYWLFWSVVPIDLIGFTLFLFVGFFLFLVWFDILWIVEQKKAKCGYDYCRQKWNNMISDVRFKFLKYLIDPFVLFIFCISKIDSKQIMLCKKCLN